ncbi:hypothetical protein BU23DRAFT_549640 [Bimuria novae-zelandiae CBS 107.79]|uniref:BZIP domain-containing protein n=1 Tax=Bimuria novae-zelandiae CBS 107.79 TaxID=1447943 RepID=A0A6A5VMK9_9PLEO|nr:hypothetical protein BU23DRAFT_549640 [Bimuria novae-zelandiae CBS 107.79]
MVSLPALPSPTSSSYTSSSTASSSPPPTGAPSKRGRNRVSAEHTLTRVRENQRRHRARRKDYIATLEQKLADTEAQLADARAEIVLLRQEREREQEQSRVRNDSVIQADISGEMMALERLVDALPTPVAGETFPTHNDLPETLLDEPSLSLSLPPKTLEIVAPTAPPCCEDTPPAASPECSSCHTRPAPLPSESTTLCAQAYVLIAQQNFRGIDAGTIRLWLYQGYRRARREGEGCRVENGALFRLLDYISGV